MTKQISEILDIEHHTVTTVDEEGTVVPAAGTNVEDTDFEVVRSNHYELIDMSKAALNTAIRVASESENPRAIEVLGNLLKITSEINRQLLVLGKDKAEVKTAKGTKTNQPVQQIGTVQQAVFVGSSSDLNRVLAERAAAAAAVTSKE